MGVLFYGLLTGVFCLFLSRNLFTDVLFLLGTSSRCFVLRASYGCFVLGTFSLFCGRDFVLEFCVRDFLQVFYVREFLRMVCFTDSYRYVV